MTAYALSSGPVVVLSIALANSHPTIAPCAAAAVVCAGVARRLCRSAGGGAARHVPAASGAPPGCPAGGAPRQPSGGGRPVRRERHVRSACWAAGMVGFWMLAPPDAWSSLLWWQGWPSVTSSSCPVVPPLLAGLAIRVACWMVLRPTTPPPLHWHSLRRTHRCHAVLPHAAHSNAGPQRSRQWNRCWLHGQPLTSTRTLPPRCVACTPRASSWRHSQTARVQI